MQRTFSVSKREISAILAGELLSVGFVTKDNLLDKWTHACIDFTTYHDIDTTGLPFVFVSSLVDFDETIIDGPAVYVACMHYFAKIKRHNKVVLFGAICIVGCVDKFSPEQVVQTARDNQEKAGRTLARMWHICL